MELFSKRLCIREFVEGDFQPLRGMESKPEMYTYEREQPSEAETMALLKESITSQNELPRTLYRMAITIQPYASVKGLIKFSQQWSAIREWEIGWAVEPGEWGRGYATEAAWTVMDWAFRELKAHRIVAFCHADNAASVRVMEKLGMHMDGRLRETRWLHGAWWDEYVYAILEHEWQENKKDSAGTGERGR